jgi:hypothetical protein
MADDTKTTDYAKIEADKKARIDKALADNKKSVEERVAKAYEIETPTPTQEENDAAKLAALGQESGEVNPPPEGMATQQPASKKTSEAAPAASSYSTRSTESKKSE